MASGEVARLKRDKSAGVWYKVWQGRFGWQRLVLCSPEEPGWSRERHPRRVTQHGETPAAAGTAQPQTVRDRRVSGENVITCLLSCLSQTSASGEFQGQDSG